MIDIGNWLRQARYRAKKNDVASTLTKPEVIVVIDNFGHKCAYCSQPAASLDNPIPFSVGAPNVQANLLPICTDCKALKRNHTICWMFDNEHLAKAAYIAVVEAMLNGNGSDDVKSSLRRLSGIADK